MHTIEEIQAKLFGIPPVRSITFGAKIGELPLFNLIEGLAPDSIRPEYNDDRSLSEQKLLAAGFHAFMFLVYDYQFDGEYSAKKLAEKLENEILHCRNRILFLNTAQLYYLLNNGTGNLSGRSGLIVASAANDDAAFYVDIHKGENLYQIFYTQNPLPKPVGIA